MQRFWWLVDISVSACVITVACGTLPEPTCRIISANGEFHQIGPNYFCHMHNGLLCLYTSDSRSRRCTYVKEKRVNTFFFFSSLSPSSSQPSSLKWFQLTGGCCLSSGDTWPTVWGDYGPFWNKTSLPIQARWDTRWLMVQLSDRVSMYCRIVAGLLSVRVCVCVCMCGCVFVCVWGRMQCFLSDYKEHIFLSVCRRRAPYLYSTIA